jgi:Fe-S cluster biogenesis protein NfuA
MSDAPHRRIRAQSVAEDPQRLGFVLDAPVQAGQGGRFDQTTDAPLPRALFDLPGVTSVEVSDATIWLTKDADIDWPALKPKIAAAIRQVLDSTDTPLGTAEPTHPDDGLLRTVQDLLERQINPSVAAHGGHIAADRVEDGRVYLRMSGGCQGCASSAATLRQGVERMLRAALPQITEIIDVTDHAAGTSPFIARQGQPDGPRSPLLIRPVPAGVIAWEDGQLMVDPDYLAPRLGLSRDGLRDGLRDGSVVGVTEAGAGPDAGNTRIVLRSQTRAWAAEVLPDGSAREIPPPRETGTAADRAQALTDRVRAYLTALPPGDAPVTYGALAAALGLWAPGSIGRITRALEATMREDAAADRPFIAARTISRASMGVSDDRQPGAGLPGRGFFDLAASLSRGPQPGETAHDFYSREYARLEHSLTTASPSVRAV